jgi:hypothetical protein
MAASLRFRQLKHWDNCKRICDEKTLSVQLAQKLKYDISTVKTRYQETCNEDREQFICAVVTVIFVVRESVRLL